MRGMSSRAAVRTAIDPGFEEEDDDMEVNDNRYYTSEDEETDEVDVDGEGYFSSSEDDIEDSEEESDDDEDDSDEEEEDNEEGLDDNDEGPTGDLTMIQRIRDGIVSKSTYNGYVGDNYYFVKWCQMNKPGWLTAYCLEELQECSEQEEGEGLRAYKSRVKKQFEHMLRNAIRVPIIHLERITTDGFMEYVSGLRNHKTGII